MATHFHPQFSIPALMPKPVEITGPDLTEPLIMNMTMAQLYGTRSNSKAAAQVLAAMDDAIRKAGKRNPGLQPDDIILGALGVVQKIWDTRMNELRAVASAEPNHMDKRHQTERRRRKSNRLTGFLG